MADGVWSPRPRRVAARPAEASAGPSPGPVSLAAAVEAMLRRSGWAARTQQTAREVLLGGQFRSYCAHHGIATIDQLTDAHAEDFLALLRPAVAPATLIKARQMLVALQRFTAATPGYRSGLTRVDTSPRPRVPERIVEVISPADEVRILRACRTERDRVIVEVLLATGIRVGELVALQVPDLHLAERPPYMLVRRSWQTETTKGRRDRAVPLEWAGGKLARRLGDYVRNRPRTHRLEVFLSHRRDMQGDHDCLTPDAVGSMVERLGEEVGVPLHPHLFRHTWATRAANAGVPMPLLQEAGGWRSLAMVQRYYTAEREAMLEAFARAHRGA